VLFKEILSVGCLIRIKHVNNATQVISSIQKEYARLQILSAEKSTKMDHAKVAMMASDYQETLV